MKNDFLNNSSGQHSRSEFHFAQSSYLSGENSSYTLEIGLQMSRFEQNESDKSNQSEEIVFDFEMLKKSPELFRETMKIFGKRSDDPEFQKLCQEFSTIGKGQDQSELTKERIILTAQFRQLTRKIDSINQNDNQTLQRYEQLFDESKRIISNLHHLKDFIKEMGKHPENNPFAKIKDKSYFNSLKKLVKFSNPEEQSPKNDKIFSSMASEQLIKARNSRKIEQRLNQIQEYQALDIELKNLIEFENHKLEELKRLIKKSKQKRNENVEEIENGQQMSFKMNIIPDKIEKIIQNIYDTKEIQKVGRPLEEYLTEINQLQKSKQSLEADLKFQESILSQKTNKCDLLEKQENEMQIKLKKLKNLSQAQTKDENEGDGINYQELILKTYQLKENRKKNERLEEHVLEIGTDFPRRAKRIVVEQQTLNWTQKIFPSIKNYKQLINLLLIIWVILLVLFFTQKTLVKNDLWFTESDGIEIKLRQKPVVHNIQTKHKLSDDQLINNKSYRLEEVRKEGDLNDLYQNEVFELKRKRMEEVNTGKGDGADDWRNKLASDFS